MQSLFETRAVAFLDILGFKEIVAEAEKTPHASNKLISLNTVVGGHVRFDNSKLRTDIQDEFKPKYIFVSDSLIISMPLNVNIKGAEGIDGLDIVVLKSTQIAQKILEMGALIRGGISVGSVWHSDSNIFGSGYIDAYNIEQKTKQPRIALSESAIKLWYHSGRFSPDMCVEYDGVHVVDILDEAYVYYGSNLEKESYYSQIAAHIVDNLTQMPLGSEQRSKWEWMAGFYNAAISRYNLNVKPFTSFPLPQ